MSDKRKKRKFAAKRQQRRQKRLAESGRLAGRVEFPPGAVLADRSQQVPNNSYSPPPEYYVDVEFTCKVCGRQEVWTAEQQKWYYEVAKGSLYGTAVRCRECRRQAAEMRGEGGNPNAIQHVGALMREVRLRIEPALAAAGFAFKGQSGPRRVDPLWLDFARPGMLLRIVCRPRECLEAECVDENDVHRVVAATELGSARSPAEFLEQIGVFTAAIMEFRKGLPPPVAQPAVSPIESE
jgi:hypothetical protein